MCSHLFKGQIKTAINLFRVYYVVLAVNIQSLPFKHFTVDSPGRNMQTVEGRGLTNRIPLALFGYVL